jgi:hypothetical protein
MPKYKVLKSVAHNTGHSFLSAMNWYDGAFPLNHLRAAAAAVGVNAVTIDLLRGEITPARVMNRAVKTAVESAATMFEYQLRVQGWAPSQFEMAELRLELPDRLCQVELVDDRGKHHIADVVQWGADIPGIPGMAPPAV